MTVHPDLQQASARRLSPSRAGVLLLAAGWLLMASSFPASLSGAAIVILLALITVDLSLGVTTGWLAFLPTSRLDERQAALRDRAYRLGFRLLAAGVLLMVVLTIIGVAAAGDNLQNLNVVPDALSARHLAALLELLAIGPTAVIAWFQDDQSGSEPRRLQAWWSLALIPLLAVAWLVAVELLPGQLLTARGQKGMFEAYGASCDHFAAEKSIAGGLAGTARMKVEVCWDGTSAFAFGDPSLRTPRDIVPIPVPASQLVAPLSMPSLPDLTSCTPLNSDGDFVNVSLSCSQQISPDGTVHLTVHGRLFPLPGGFGSRELTIQLVVSRDGKVLAEV